MNRRNLIKYLVAASIFPLSQKSSAAASFPPQELKTPISIILPDSIILPSEVKNRRRYEYKLRKAVLDFIQQHYSSSKMPVWKVEMEQVDMEKRIINIVYWVIKACQKHAGIYYVDPAWIMAQIMAESFFYEFAVSGSLAVGICQFIAPTAIEYGITCPENASVDFSQIKMLGMSSEYKRLQVLKNKKRQLMRENSELFNNQDELLRQSLLAQVHGKSMPKAQWWLYIIRQVRELDKSISQARQNYIDYLRANFEGRSIFDQQDLSFLLQFDERVTYKKPIMSMVEFMAKNIRSRNGNILAATAGYNAGLSNTNTDYRVYKPYGRIPSFRETVNYVSQIVVNHHEIVSRM